MAETSNPASPGHRWPGRALFWASLAALVALLVWILWPYLFESGPWHGGKRLSVWLRLLENNGNPEQGKARRILAGFGPGDAASVPLLVAQVRKHAPSREVRRALIRIGPASAPAIRDALSDPDPFARHRAAATLERIEPGAADTVEALCGLLRMQAPENSSLREDTLETLAEIGQPAAPAIPLLIEALKDDKIEHRVRAAWALGRIGPQAKEAILAMEEAQKFDDPKDTDRSRRLRGIAQTALTRIRVGDKGGPAKPEPPKVPELVKRLKDSDERVRWEAALALTEIAPEMKEAFQVLLEWPIPHAFFGDQTDRHRWARALGRSPNAEDSRARKLIEELNAFDLELLFWEGAKKRPPVARLVSMLRDPRLKWNLRWSFAAADELIRSGPAAMETVPQLRELLKEPKLVSAALAADLLWRIERSAEGLPALIHGTTIDFQEVWGPTASRDHEGKLRHRALECISRMAPTVPAAAEALLKLYPRLNGMYGLDWGVICEGLRQLAPRALPLLEQDLADADQPRHSLAWKLLPELRTPEAAGVLLEFVRKHPGDLDDPINATPQQKERSLRAYEAITALGRMGTVAKLAVPDLMKMAQMKRHPDVWISAVRALGGIGPDAAEAAPFLIERMYFHPNVFGVQCPAAAIALWRIEKNKEALQLLLEELAEGTRFNAGTDDVINFVSALDPASPEARAAVPILRRLAARWPVTDDHSNDPWAGRAVKSALEKLEGR